MAETGLSSGVSPTVALLRDSSTHYYVDEFYAKIRPAVPRSANCAPATNAVRYTTIKFDLIDV